MAGVKRNEFTEAMKKQSYGWFWERYDITPPKWSLIFDVVQSDAAYEQFTSAIGLGELLEKPEGEDLQTDAPLESYTIVCRNRSFGRLVRFSYETVQDAKSVANILADTVGTWGEKLPVTKEKWYSNFFNKGAFTAGYSDTFDNSITGVVTDSSGAKIYDSQPFFSDTHTSKAGTAYDNYVASTALTHANLQTAYETYTLTNAYDERDDMIELLPNVLLIPPALNFTAQAILQTAQIPGSMDNDINVLRNIIDPLDWRYLTDTDGWFLGRLKMGLMATDREDVGLDFWQDETNKDYYASIFTRFGGCVTNWRYWLAHNTSQS